MKNKKNQKVTVEISFKTIVQTVVFLVGLYVFFLLKDLFLGLFISVLLATGLNPLVTFIEKAKIPRPIAIIIVYFLIGAVLVGLASVILPPLVKQTEKLLELLPVSVLSDALTEVEVSLENIELISSQIGSVIPLFKIASSTFSGLITFFTFAVITFYLLIERKKLHVHISRFSPNIHSENRAEDVVNKIETQIGSWVRGQIILMLAVGLLTYVGLTLLHIQFALPLAIIAGILEIIPNIGPIVSAVPAVMVPLLVGGNPVISVFVIALYILVQQVENNFLVPKVMQSAVGIHPLVTILLIIIGLKLTGVPGAILAVPLYLVSKVVYIELAGPLWKHWSKA